MNGRIHGRTHGRKGRTEINDWTGIKTSECQPKSLKDITNGLNSCEKCVAATVEKSVKAAND